ncbi:MAG: PIN domain-containing protein [Candidatus Aminicenantes bacterium]|nr:PIN domain-containing protein [Candidatus Aminicenantes bacterium]NIM82982.1 PIN domain-containing protein [Candidatus Aminicenantes bacterium]NIN22367.1 PIN domain-containing protein [Candidatus Aminicenantes bacterium]NIN46127.1 PIN domain-containing protein [Candidatus Aminicenantes bacterium]NIN88963.1 PIN domain-containing protein [Candidatus Aminicenantes bacterium]
MKYLLDTHIWIWSVSNPKKLSEEVKEILKNKSHELFISSISFWEFMVLLEKGRITISKPVDKWIKRAVNKSNIKEIPIDKKIAIQSRKMELPHQDPADRFIAATAFLYQLSLITSDGKLAKNQDITIIFNKV